MAAKKNAAGFGLSGLAALIFVFFALPWTTFSCMGTDMMHQSGYQVIAGSATTVEREGGKKGEAFEDTDKQLKEEGDKDSIAAWWLALAPLGALVALISGIMIARGKASFVGIGLIASVISAGILSLVLIIGTPIESKVAEAKKEMMDKSANDKDNPMAGLGNAFGEMMAVKRHNAPIFATVTAWLMVGLSIYLRRVVDDKPAYVTNWDSPK